MREAVFQLTGGVLALVFSLATMFAATRFLGRAGVLALAWAVPVGVLTGYATIRLLRFAHRILSDHE